MSNLQEDDVEAALLFAETLQEVKWDFIRKLFAILTLQFLTTSAVAAAVAALHPISLFFSTTWAGFAVYIFILVFLLIVTCFLAAFQHIHPHNFILLGIFTLCFGLVFGFASSFIDDPVMLVAAIATAVVVVSLIAYTFWAEKRGDGFGFVVPFTIAVVIIGVEFTLLQMYFPMKRLSDMIWSGVAVVVLSAYIIFHTSHLSVSTIVYAFYPYIWASVKLYLDVFNNLFNLVLRILGSCIVFTILIRALFCPPETPNADDISVAQTPNADTATTHTLE